MQEYIEHLAIKEHHRSYGLPSPEEEYKYCDMPALSVAWRRLDKHVSSEKDINTTIDGIVRGGVFYAVCAEAM
jgi:hypothetical protein